MTNVLRTATVGERCYVLVSSCDGCEPCRLRMPDLCDESYYIELPRTNAPEMGRRHAE
jgi:D-arabinose 1-dehydrogenase-like Zn-dependent alcohol dehydrogenase